MTILKLIFAIILSFLPGVIGMMFSPSGNSDMWYNMLDKSVLNPPTWVFPVVWNLLYLALGVALFMILIRGWNQSKKPMIPFVLNMVLNAFWSFLFFGLHLPVAALLNIIAMIAVAVWMKMEFQRVSKPAGYLVWPYIAWLCFAAYLNYIVIALN